MGNQVFNPFLPEDVYIPDSEPHVFGDRIYLFGSHDQEDGDSFCLLDYEGWSAPIYDLSKWESAGIIYSAKQDPKYSEKRPYMYAPDVVCGNDGRYYLYYCLAGWKGEGGYDGPVSVAVSDSPNGKYEYYGFVRNPDGTEFQDCVLFDPAVINDDGVIRLYTGTGLPMGLEITKWNRLMTAGIAERMYHRPKSAFKEKQNPLGAYMIELCEDMYYFIYSSQKNHELCYATSKYPDHGFVYGGTIISNGDVGYKGRRDEQRLNTTGTTHGSMENINGQWYVFYHRLSHGSDYSRQACAELIDIKEDGTIEQVEMTSCGLNGGPLKPEGIVPGTKACNLTNGKMPHIGNKKYEKPIPKVTNEGDIHYITGISDNVWIGFKYFEFSEEPMELKISVRGNGTGKFLVYTEEQMERLMTEIEVMPEKDWKQQTAVCSIIQGIRPLYLKYKGTGEVDLLQIEMQRKL